MRALMRALSGSACGCPCCEAPRNRRCAVCACHPRRHLCSHSGLSPTCIIFHFMSRFSLLYNSFNSIFSRSHFSHMFSLYFHGILGVVFTHSVGYSRPPSAVNDPTVIKQLNSENHPSNKCPNHFFYQISLINRCWVRLRGDSRKKNATMILASSTKTKNSFASIFGCVELHLLCLLTVAKKTMLV